MFQSLFVFQVGIVFLCIVTHTRGEQSSVFPTNERYEWFEAKDKCRLLTNERNFSSHTTRLGWTNFSAKYLPWVEYLGCFKFWDGVSFNGKEKRVTEGEQLQECIIHCNRSQLFGLQESTCICLPNSSLLYESVEKPCNTNVATCSRDSFAFCGKVGSGRFLSVYRKASVKIGDRYDSLIGNCLEFDNRNRGSFKVNNCSTELYPLCYKEVYKTFNTGKTTKSKWTDAFNNCQLDNLANYSTVIGKINEMTQFSAKFWLSNTRRWTRIIDVTGNPYFCVAARIKQNCDVERIIHKCRDRLPALCVGVRKTSTDAPSKASSTLSLGTSFSSRFENTSPSLRSKIFQGLTISTYSASLRSTFSSQFMSTTPALKKTTGRSKGVQETTSSSPDFKETTSSVLVESTSSDLPGKDGVSAIVIIAIIAATILIVIVILVTIVLFRRKRNTQVPTSNESLAMVGKEVVYAQVNKPTVKREKSTSRQKSQPTASDDTYDHMDHCRLSQTHNPIESNYDTMRSIANAGEEENKYDHVTGTKMEPERFVVDGASNYCHVEVEFHEVKDI